VSTTVEIFGAPAPVSVAVTTFWASLIAEEASVTEEDSLEVRIPDETLLIRISPIIVTKIVETIKVVAIILKLKDLFQACLN
jgi:hypothetical protein